jgi:hypothetical protein
MDGSKCHLLGIQIHATIGKNEPGCISIRNPDRIERSNGFFDPGIRERRRISFERIVVECVDGWGKRLFPGRKAKQKGPENQ